MKRRRGGSLRHKWSLIPDDTNVLITHGPAWGTLDLNWRSQRCGCELLENRLLHLRPDLHIFGHIHDSGGVTMRNIGAKVSINAAMLGEDYVTLRDPIVWDMNYETEYIENE